MFRVDHRVKPFNDIPLLPGGRPVLGHLMDFRDDPLGMFERARQTCGDRVRTQIANRKVLFVYAPEDVQHILINNPTNYEKATRGYSLVRVLLKQGVLTAEGPHWRKQRRTLQPAFHRRAIETFAEAMVDAASEVVADWSLVADTPQDVDVHHAMNRLTLRVICEVLFGKGIGARAAVVDRELTALLHGFDHMVTAPWPLPQYVPTPHALRFHLARFRLYRVVDAVIAERRASGAEHPDLLGMLMAARDEETGEAMSDEQLRMEVLTLILAGHETTANALAWTLMILSQEPEAAARLEDEVDRVLGDRRATLADYAALEETDRVLREAMRLHPPAWLMSRASIGPDVIGGHHIPAGTFVFMCQHTIQRHPDLYEDPDRFDPDRWLPERAKRRAKLAYFPFGAGQRKCIGEQMAWMESRLVLATLVQNYRFTLVEGHPTTPETSVTLRPKHGLRMRLEKRG
jgi:cytochrome P450